MATANLVLEPLSLVSRTDGEFALYAWRGLALIVWEGPATLEGMRELDRAFSDLRDKDGQYTLIHILNERTALPSGELRGEFERLSKRHEASIGGVAILDRRRGFMAGAINAVLAGLSLVQRNKPRMKLFSDVEELLTWVMPIHKSHAVGALDEDDLQKVLDRVREASA